MTDSKPKEPTGAGETTEQFLTLHEEFFARMTPDLSRTEFWATTYASIGTLNTAVSLAWVAREFGQDKADALADILYRYSVDGDDYEGLFEDKQVADTRTDHATLDGVAL